MTAKELFYTKIRGKNIMTPKLIEFDWIVSQKVVYELSEGTDFKHKPIFGLTIVGEDIDRSDYSTLCFSLEEAREKIEEVKEELNA